MRVHSLYNATTTQARTFGAELGWRAEGSPLLKPGNGPPRM
jgi:hypothetical protein